MIRRTSIGLTVLSILASAVSSSFAQVSDELLRVRSIALAHYQNEHFAKSAAVYRECVELAPESVVDRINLAVAEGKARETENALASAEAALRIDPSYPQSLYLIGLMHFRMKDMPKAVEAFGALLERDPFCAPALYAYGQALSDLGRKDEAVAAWKEVIRLDPNHGPTFYQLFRHLTAAGESEDAAAAFEEFIRIKNAGLGPGKTEGAVFRSRHFELLEESVPVARAQGADGEITIRLDLQELFGGVTAGVLAVEDFDADEDDDLFLDGKLYRNESGAFTLVGPIPGIGRVDDARFGDIDNDGHLDLAVLGESLVLLSGDGQGGFTPWFEHDATASPGGQGIIRLVDIDHEGDLDLIFAVAGGELTLLRNNGNRTFTDVTRESGMIGMGSGLRALELSDLESDFDVDVLVLDGDGRAHLFVNERDGTFVEEASEAGLGSLSGLKRVLAGDVNSDANPDLILFDGNGAHYYANRGDARFVRDTNSPVLERETATIGATHGALVDLDNDGDLDLLASGREILLFRNDAAGGWRNWSAALAADARSSAREFGAGDFDADGDPDLVFAGEDGTLALLQNQGGSANRSVRVRLTGTKNTLDGYGCKVWTKQAGFFQLRETNRRWVDLGVGKREKLDVLGVRWPTGVTQNEIDFVVGAEPVVRITERPGLAESCPFVYAYDGERFRFVTDFLDVAPLGISLAPGVPYVPQTREAVLISGDRLSARDDRYSLRVTQELREITYLDRVELFVIDRPGGSAVVPNDRFVVGPTPERGLHFAAETWAPVSATNGRDEDRLAAVLEADRVYADDCEAISKRYPGITQLHSLVLDPGASAPDQPLMLFLRASTLWTEASINVAVSQNDDIHLLPVSLDVIGADGEWVRVADDLGLPSGVDKFLPVDLEGVFPTQDRRVRLTTNLAVLWDQAFFAVGPTLHAGEGQMRVERLAVLSADLHYRGFSDIYSPDGRLPDLYDYEQILPQPLFDDVHAGDYTRYGDVTPLLTSIDDRYVILAPGDEIAIEFPAIMLPELPSGWVREFVFEAEGWIKDGDLRTVTGDRVDPYPFHGMESYPYAAEDSYPTDAMHRSFLEQYQTRTLPPWTKPPGRP